MTPVLDGIKVVELSMYAYVPSAAAMLADWGADVIKVEHPAYGDPMRGMQLVALHDVDTGHNQIPFTSDVVNRNKRAIAVDVGTSAGHDVVMELVDGADVFLTNFLGPALTRLRVDAATVMARNPSIVYARGTGQGSTGPEADDAGFDSVSFWARSGVASSVTARDAPIPAPLPGMGFGDLISGAMLAGGVCAALVRRASTGEGVEVDGSLLAAGLWAMGPAVTAASLFGVADLRLTMPRDRTANALASSFRTADGDAIVLAMLDSQRYWPGLCAALGLTDAVDDPRLATAAARAEHSAHCMRMFDEWFGAHTTAECTTALSKQDGAWQVYAVARDALDDVQARTNGYVQDVDYGTAGTAAMVSAPVHFNGVPPVLHRGPEHGEHTELVLLELGKSWDEIAALREAGVIP